MTKHVYFFEPKRKCSNQILATKNGRRPSNAKRIRTVRKVKYVISFDNKGPGKYFRDAVLRKLKKLYKRRRQQTGLKYLWLLHDNAQANKARTET
jgi:hypothetical protein